MTTGLTVQAAAVPPECKQIVKDCNSALSSADAEIQAQKVTIDLQDQALKASYQDNENLRIALEKESDKNSSILRNPWFDGALGIIAVELLRTALGHP